MNRYHRFTIASVAALVCSTGVAAAYDDPAPTPTGETKKEAAEPIKVPLVSPLRFGAETYMGVSNLPGRHRMPDGFWAGVGPNEPSVLYAQWDGGRGNAVKLSLGVGGMYTGSSTTLRQPVEAWWQMPAGKMNVTVGKFWVPFASQEWEYESKPGMMLQWGGPVGVSLSVNQNSTTRAVNSYLRVSRDLGHDSVIGVSGALGRGLSYDSVHDRAWGVDGLFSWKGWQFATEYVQFNHASGRFGFGFSKLSYEELGPWKPWVGYYAWNDAAGAFDRMRSTAYGLGYQLTKSLVVEAGYAATSAKGVTWLQTHWTWER